jgi:para-nitrobenzyl esterase
MLKKVIIGLIIVILVGAIGMALYVRSLTPDQPVPRVVTADSETERVVNAGKIVGFLEDNGSHSWLGIPFAKPPVGPLRWKAPLPAEAWTEPVQALEVGNMCTQPSGALSGEPDADEDSVSGKEDCLYLNVWAPAFKADQVPAASDRVPVMVWIHGGGNSIGNGGSYNGSVLANDYQLVVVSINYRLGPFGWFTHPALRSDQASAEDNSGNYGTLDVIRSLEWVRDNISRFGGDPDNVTIFGNSAGGTDVMSMMVSPLAERLFHRAIVQSGGLRINPIAAGENYQDDTPPGHPYSSREVINTSLIRDGLAQDRDAAKGYQDKKTGAFG